jgi:uncharacterized protein YoxC
MLQVTIICGVIIITLALLADSSATVTCVTTIITIRGISWVMKKITQNVNKDCSEIIDFTGWTIAGISIVRLLKLSLRGLQPVIDTCQDIGNSIQSIGQWMQNAQEYLNNIGKMLGG